MVSVCVPLGIQAEFLQWLVTSPQPVGCHVDMWFADPLETRMYSVGAVCAVDTHDIMIDAVKRSGEGESETCDVAGR